MQMPIVNIILWSSTLPPLRVPCVHKNWSSVPLVAFLARKINKEQKPHQKNLFKGTYIKVGTQNWHVWVTSIKVWLSICFSLLANSSFLSALKTSVSLLSEKSISHEQVKKKTWATRNSFFHCFITSDSDHIFFCYIWKHKIVITTTK